MENVTSERERVRVFSLPKRVNVCKLSTEQKREEIKEEEMKKNKIARRTYRNGEVFVKNHHMRVRSIEMLQNAISIRETENTVTWLVR